MYCFLSYLVGGIPFGLIFTRFFLGKNIRHFGSKNIGATNVMRMGSKTLGILTFLCDAAKGYLVCFLPSQETGVPFHLVFGICAVLGHVFSPWLRFRGGKGVATIIGVYLALNVWVGILFGLSWLMTYALYKTSFKSGLLSLAFAPIWSCFFFTSSVYISAMVFLFILCIWTHRLNLRQMLEHKENVDSNR